MTSFEIKCEILADFWMEYRKDSDFADFIEYSDLGLPLAYAIHNGIVESSPLSQEYISETFSLLLSGVGIEEDTGFETLLDVLGRPE